ncbi:hypothetical protein LEP1GSC040_3892 [Leptospira santarosai str. 2000030832]|nr:hypothetical protein LEP1GSC040_3892 [Leptospira santarosai str. 2000030832]
MSESFHSSIRFRKFLRDRIFRLGKRTIYKIIFLFFEFLFLGILLRTIERVSKILLQNGD